jgi:hypothetical protein
MILSGRVGAYLKPLSVQTKSPTATRIGGRRKIDVR